MVKVAVVLDVFPQSSDAVKITVALPVAPQSSLRLVKLLDQVTPLQMSEATAPPLLDSQAFRAAVLPVPSHSTVWLEASVSMLGSTLSSMVKVSVMVLAFMQSSMAVNVTVALPVSPQSLLRPSKSWDHVTVPQSSVAVAPPWSSSQAFNSVGFPVPSHSAS